MSRTVRNFRKGNGRPGNGDYDEEFKKKLVRGHIVIPAREVLKNGLSGRDESDSPNCKRYWKRMKSKAIRRFGKILFCSASAYEKD